MCTPTPMITSSTSATPTPAATPAPGGEAGETEATSANKRAERLAAGYGATVLSENPGGSLNGKLGAARGSTVLGGTI